MRCAIGLFFLFFCSYTQNLHASQEWFRNDGEWLANRTVRPGVATEPSTKLVTNGARYDATIGKRIPLFNALKDNPRNKIWIFGADGGMLATLHRVKSAGLPIFATETFDGFFGVFSTYSAHGYMAMLRWGHLSAHLVDDAASFPYGIRYSHFFIESSFGKTWPNPLKSSRWDLHIQGTIGLNYASSPPKRSPRRRIGTTGGYSPWGADKLAIISSFDAINAGINGQKNSYGIFCGFGYLNRPQSTHRPFRIGATHYWGADYRNQYFANKAKFTGLELQIEL